MRRNKPGYKGPNVKPDIWGPPSDVAKAVRDYFENKLGVEIEMNPPRQR